MNIATRLQERQAQLRGAEIHAAECRGIVRGLQMVARRHPLLTDAEAQERAAAQHAETLRGAVAELEGLITAIQAAQAAHEGNSGDVA